MMKLSFLSKLTCISCALFVNLSYSKDLDSEEGVVIAKTMQMLSTYQDDYFSGVELSKVSSSNSFEEQLNFTEKKIKFFVVGMESVAQPLKTKAKLSLYEFKIENVDEIINYLESIGVKHQYAIDISSSLSKNSGKHNRLCTGTRADCLVPANDSAVYVIDFYNDQVRVMLPNDYFETEEVKKKYIVKDKLESQLVSSFYANYNYYDSDFDGQSQSQTYFFNARNHLGFFDGYFSFEFNGNQNDFNLNNLEYIYDFYDFSLISGFSRDLNRHSSFEQRSSFLNNKDFVGLTLSKTNNLAIDQETSKIISLYSPSSGILEVKKDGAVVYQGFAQAGLNKIQMSLLPKGIYNAEFVIKNGNSVIISERRNIDNMHESNNMFTYYAKYGHLINSEVALPLTEVGVRVPIFMGISFDSIGYLVKDTFFYSTGLNFNPLPDASFNFVTTKINEAEQIKFNFSYMGNSLQFTDGTGFGKIKDNDLKNILNVSEYSDFRQASLNLFYPLNSNVSLNGSAFYTKNKTNSTSSLDYKTGISFSIFNDVYASIDYSFGDAGKTIYFNINIPFGNKLNLSNSLISNDTGLVSDASVNYNSNLTDTLTTNINTTFPVINNSDMNGNYRLGASLTEFNDKLNSTVRANYSNDSKEVGATFATTQIINSEGFFYTSDSSVKSSLFVENKSFDKKKENENIGNLILTDYATNGTKYYDLKNITLVNFNDYISNSIRFNVLDQYKTLLYSDINLDDSIDFIPGKFRRVIIDVADVSELLVIANSSDLKRITCVSDSCVGNSMIEQAAIKFEVKAQNELQILLGDKICWSGMVKSKSKVAIVCE